MNKEEIEYHITKLKLHQLYELKRSIELQIEVQKDLDKFKINTEKLDQILLDMKSCDQCLDLKRKGVIPGCCQYHLDKQMED